MFIRKQEIKFTKDLNFNQEKVGIVVFYFIVLLRPFSIDERNLVEVLNRNSKFNW